MKIFLKPRNVVCYHSAFDSQNKTYFDNYFDGGFKEKGVNMIILLSDDHNQSTNKNIEKFKNYFPLYIGWPRNAYLDGTCR